MRRQLKIGTCLVMMLALLLIGTGAYASDLADEPLKVGSQSDMVRQVQERLFALGYFESPLYPAETDGVYGDGTALAVKWFQRANDLHPDGEVGEITYGVLFIQNAVSFQTYQENNEDFYWILERYCEGEEVVDVQMRLRDLGYFNYKVTGFYGPSTTGAVKEFQQLNNITADGNVGSETRERLFSLDAVRKTVVASPADDYMVVSRGGKRGTVLKLNWFTEGQYAFRRGDIATVTDVYTGIQFRMKRTGGVNHADIEPVSASDAAKMKKAWGGAWSWARRPVICEVERTGVRIAGSMNGMPHGYDSISGNGMSGQVCMHMYMSRNHVHNALDPTHQRCVDIAAGIG